MRVLLIYPNIESPLDGLYKPHESTLSLSGLLKNIARKEGTGSHLPPLGLLQLAGKGYGYAEHILIDEQFETATGEEIADLVAISATTRVVDRAYDLAKIYLTRGIPVILGGAHPTLMPEEAMERGISVCVGEGDAIWEQILAHAKGGKLLSRYDAGRLDLGRFKLPNYELLKREHYLTTNLLQTGRGCRFQCEFCSVPAIAGDAYRHIPISSLRAFLAERAKQFVLFTDDNLYSDREWFYEVASACKEYQVEWFGAANLNIADDREALEWLRKSRCRILLVGFESLDATSIQCYRKPNRVTSYRKQIDALHAAGVALIGCFIFGAPEDTESTANNLLMFIKETGIDLPVFNLLTPYPGSKLYRNLIDEKKLTPGEWWRYDGCSCYLAKHPRLEANYWETMMLWLWSRAYTLGAILRRVRKIDKWALILLRLNLAYRSVGWLIKANQNLAKSRSIARRTQK